MSARRFVLGLDGSSGAEAARDWCLEHAAELDAEIIAVCVVEVPAVIDLPQAAYGAGSWLEALHEQRCREIEEWVRPLRDNGISCRTLVRDGCPAEVLQIVADEEMCELIVVGRRGAAGFAELLLGSVPHALTHHARRPVVVVPA